MTSIITEMLRRRSTLCDQRAVMLQYANMKFETNNDWHGVADAAMDIRELNAQIGLLDDLLRFLGHESAA